MLNISKSSVKHLLELEKTPSTEAIFKATAARNLNRWLAIFLLITLMILFLPWTQNIQSNGKVTNLQPGQRPQVVNSVIAGRIEKWYVQEGQFVEKGDTILFISEVKDDYFDPELLTRTRERLAAQEGGISAYGKKITAIDQQINALLRSQALKFEQARNKVRQGELKVTSDSLEVMAARSNYEISEKQFKRQKELYDQGLKSLTELENLRQKNQDALSKFVGAENKLLASKNELLNAKIEINSISADFNDKVAKSESEKYSALSDMSDAESKLAKTLNEISNYTIRSSMYFVLAPQSGYISQALQSGIGETIKEGEAVVRIVPAESELAVEMFVRPVDLPLLKTGHGVRFVFDGWPSIVFSGWPGASVGTYGGRVFAIDNVTNDQGLYRILVAPDPQDVAWPKGLRMGSGAKGFALLKTVPVWYELWRQLNGFPPEYYLTNADSKQDKE